MEEERTRCEIFTRIVGYIRPTAQWNPSKVSEFADRTNYEIEGSQEDKDKLE
jgi:anaerobic ribonucleoside-triphosphate reductase